MTSKQILLIVLLAAAPFGAAAHAQSGFTVGGDIGVTNAPGHGRSYDFGLDAGYRLDSVLGLELSYASLTHYETTLVGASAIVHHPIARRLHLLGQFGLVFWTESPTGYDGSGEAPLLGVGLSYALAPASSARVEYQLVPGASGRLGANLYTLIVGLQQRF